MKHIVGIELTAIAQYGKRHIVFGRSIQQRRHISYGCICMLFHLSLKHSPCPFPHILRLLPLRQFCTTAQFIAVAVQIILIHTSQHGMQDSTIHHIAFLLYPLLHILEIRVNAVRCYRLLALCFTEVRLEHLRRVLLLLSLLENLVRKFHNCFRQTFLFCLFHLFPQVFVCLRKHGYMYHSGNDS